MIWALFALMIVAAVAAGTWPLRRRGSLPPVGEDVAVYRDQLGEIERDRNNGAIGAAEAEAARIEVSRRLIAAASKASQEAPYTIAGVRPLTAVVVALAVPAVAALFYLPLGSPDVPGQPLAERIIAAHRNGLPDAGRNARSTAELVARVEAYLKDNPDDGRGWEVIAPVFMRMGRFQEAIAAHTNAIRLLGSTADREANLGEALVAASNGVVTSEAKAAFDRAIATAPENTPARYYLGLAAEQEGRVADAVSIWRGMLDGAPPDASWVGIVRQGLARLQGASAPGPTREDMTAAESMSPEQRQQMVQNMIDRLATRLKQDGSDVDGWLRLVRAYIVLGARDKAKNAMIEARRALANDAEKLHRLDDGATGLGLDG
jgi:cytochrome c-type biogenesis protein CcmH